MNGGTSLLMRLTWSAEMLSLPLNSSSSAERCRSVAEDTESVYTSCRRDSELSVRAINVCPLVWSSSRSVAFFLRILASWIELAEVYNRHDSAPHGAPNNYPFSTNSFSPRNHRGHMDMRHQPSQGGTSRGERVIRTQRHAMHVA